MAERQRPPECFPGGVEALDNGFKKNRFDILVSNEPGKCGQRYHRHRPSTRKSGSFPAVTGGTLATVDQSDAAADEVIADAGFCVDPTADAITETLSAALNGTRPPTDPVDHARQDDWDAIAEQAETVGGRSTVRDDREGCTASAVRGCRDECVGIGSTDQTT